MAEEQQQLNPFMGVEFEGSALDALLEKEFKPRSDRAKEEVAGAVRTLAEYALKGVSTISDDAVGSIKAIIAGIDQALTAQINEIIHHEAYQKIEGTWRGLHHLVNNTETDEMLKIRVFNISKPELAKTLKRYRGTAWDQSPIFKKLYEAEYGQLGGEPYGCLVGDYYFDHSPPDVDMLRSISQVAAAAHAPFIAAAAPDLLGMESFQQLTNPRDLAKIFSTPEYAGWRSLRETQDSRYVGLCMPRFLGRQPYGEKTNPVEEFGFEEDMSRGDHQDYCWVNSAYAMAVNVNRAFKMYGWCTQIRGVESGGVVENLPVHTFPSDDGGVDAKCPTEIAISDRREAELSNCGLLPLIHRKGSDMAVFIGGQSLQKAQEYDDPDASSNARLSARLPYIFAVSRFAHYLKCIVRDKIGGYEFSTAEQVQLWLHNWIMNYVESAPEFATAEQMAKRPLSAAEVQVEADPENPGYYSARFYLKPHYQLEGLSASMRLVSKLPSQREGR